VKFKVFDKSLILVIVFIPLLLITSCTSFNNWADKNYNYGKIIEVNQNEVIISVGDQGAVRMGQILNVYKSIKAHSGFTRRNKKIIMGVIQIKEFIGELNAKAAILFGTIDKDCFIEI
jgi:hypothetical protein